jgi:hypothetical protein
MEPELVGNYALLLSLSRGQCNHQPEENTMSKRFLISVATAALLAGAGFANAQNAPAGAAAGAAAHGSSAAGAPSAAGSAEQHATPMTRDSASDAKGSESGMKSSQTEDKAAAPAGANSQRAQDAAPGQKSKMSSDNNADSKAGKDMKADSRDGKMNNAESKGAADTKAGDKSAADNKSQDAKSGTTTGQAAAGGKLSTEQRTKITTVIKQQNIQPVTNVNFSISVGTRVPRETRFHPLPAEIVTMYPDWRGYEFILVSNQIIVVNPQTFEIVAVLDV